MSQVRGRIKTVVKYNDQLNTVGTCCGSDGTKTEKSFSQCSAEGGRWVPVLPIEDVECPNVSDRGCCCSCAYTTKNTGTPDDWTHPDHREDLVFRKRGSPDGLRDNISRCECSYYEGNWNEGECPSSEQEIRDFCYLDPDVGVEGRDDVRWPFACCHCKYDANDEVYRECSSVCLSRDCAALGEGFEQTGFNCIPEFDPFKICDYEFNGQPKECPEVEDAVFGCTNPACDNYDPNADYDDGSCIGCDDGGGGGTGPEEPTGACCQGTQCTDNLTAAQCAGIGGVFQGENVSCVSDPCNSSPPPPPPPGTILGCTDPAASNYNPDATEDDGSCEYSPPPPPPPEVTCSNGGSTYSIPVDVSGLGWVDENNNPVSTVFRPTDNDGSVTDEGPEIRQQLTYMHAAGVGTWANGEEGNCGYGCGAYCPTNTRGPTDASAYAFNMRFPKRTLGKEAAEKCVTICHDGPNEDEPDSPQHIEWRLATKKLKLGPAWWATALGDVGPTGPIIENEQPSEEIGVRWGCKRRYKHPYRCNKEGFDPYISASYVNEYRDVGLVDENDPDSGVIFIGETLDAYMEFREESKIQELWDEYFVDGVSNFSVPYSDVESGTIFATFIDFDPDNYDPFNIPLFNQELYKEELIKQFDFGSIDANLSLVRDESEGEFGDPTGSLIVDAGRQDCGAVPGNEQQVEYGNPLDELCSLYEIYGNPLHGLVNTLYLRLGVKDPDDVPVLRRTKRCYDVCMQADTPLHLKKYDRPRLVWTPASWGWFPQFGTWNNCNDPFPPELPTRFEFPDNTVYAKNYNQAITKCEEIRNGVVPPDELNENGVPEWPPQKVEDFYYVISTSTLLRWGTCLSWGGICDQNGPGNECWLHWLWERGRTGISSVVLPTASLYTDSGRLPSSWSFEPNINRSWYGYYALENFLLGNPNDCNPDGTNIGEQLNNCVLDGAAVATCSGGESYYNWQLPSGYLFNDGPRGACLNSFSASWSFAFLVGKNCEYVNPHWKACCEFCNSTDCGSGFVPRQPHPNNPEQPKTPFRDDFFSSRIINQGKYIDPRQAGIEIPKSQDASACCVANYEGDKFTCSYMTRKDCEMQNGFFNIPDEDGPITCSKTICPALPTRSKSGFVTPPSIKSSDLPEPGKLFAGGIYIGTFKPGISQVLTSVETGSTGRLKTCSADGPGDKRSWAIILAPTDLGAEFGLDSMMYRYITASEKIPQTQTSLFDGLYNTYGNDKSVRQAKTSLMKQIKNYNLYGFKDWYLPSVEELGFVGAQQRDLDFGVNLGRYSQNQSKLGSDTPYMTSSRKISKKKPSKSLTRDFTSYPSANLVYGVLVGNSLGPMNGFTILSGLDNTFRVRLARRIYVED